MIKLSNSTQDLNISDFLLSGGVLTRKDRQSINELSVVVELEKDLRSLLSANETLEQQKFALEREKLSLEEGKTRTENIWKAVAALGSVLSAVLTFIAAYNFHKPSTTMKEAGAINESGSKTVNAKASAEIVSQIFLRSNDFLTADESILDFNTLLKKTKKEAWFVGTNFYHSAESYKDDIVRIVRSGVTVNFIVIDPFSNALPEAAEFQNTKNNLLREQCITGIRAFKMIKEDLDKFKGNGEFIVKFFPRPLLMRMYLFDPGSPEGHSYFVPQINTINSLNLPGYMLSNEKWEYQENYFNGVRNLWASRDLLSFDRWLALHPL